VDREGATRQRELAERGIQLAGGDERAQAPPIAILPYVDARLGRLGDQARDRAGHQAASDGLEGADAQDVVVMVGGVHVGQCGVEPGEDVLGMNGQPRPHLGGRHLRAPTRALHDACADHPLELRDALAERRLGEPQTRRSAPERAGSQHGEQGLQVARLDPQPPHHHRESSIAASGLPRFIPAT
jgi:hypothetical protein